MLKRSLHIAGRQLFYLTAISITLGLLLLITAIWLSDQVAERKDEIASWASQQSGYPVEIEKAGLYWLDLIPKLEIRQVKVMAKQGNTPIFQAGQIYLAVDVFSSIRSGELMIADASIRNAKVNVEHTADGQFRVKGYESQPQQALSEDNIQTVFHWLTRLKQSQLSNIQVQYKDENEPALTGLYTIEHASLSFNDEQLLAEADLNLPDSLGNHLNLSATAHIDKALNVTSWQGQVRVDEVSLGSLLKKRAYRGAKLDEGLLSATLNVQKVDNQALLAELELELSDATLSSSKPADEFTEVSLEQLVGHFQLDYTANQWQVEGKQIQIRMAGEDWPITTFDVKSEQSGALSGYVSFVRLSDVTAMALLMNEMPAILVNTKPAGDLQNVAFAYTQQSGLDELSMSASGVSFLPWQDYPGANDVSFSLDKKKYKGTLELNSRATSIYADTWLPDSVLFDSITGQLTWQNQDASWRVNADALQIWNDDLNILLNGEIQQANGITDTNLILTIQDVVVNTWRNYVPKRILPADFEEWSADAFRQGIIRSGTITMKGDPSAFPFESEPERGSFDMKLNVEDVQLHYGPGWPDIMHVNGTVEGQGNNLLIQSESGQIAGFNFNKVTTTISNLVKSNPILKVSGLLNGSTSNALAFLKQSPLKSRFGSIDDWLQAKGSSDIQLDLTVPLVDPDSAQAKGYVSFNQSQLITKAITGLEVNKINGRLFFSNNGVSADKITATAFDEPIEINAKTEQDKTYIDINGRVAVSTLNQHWPGTVPAFVTGESDYLTGITVSEPSPGEFELNVSLRTDLQGISIDAPEPLGKSASLPVRLQAAIQEKDDGMLYTISYSDWLNAAIHSNAGKSLSGQIKLGGQSAGTNVNGLQLTGNIETLDIQPWLDWQESLPDTTNASALDLIDGIDLTLSKVFITDQVINHLQLSGQHTSSDWQFDLNSPQIKGRVSIPKQINNQTPLNINLDYLNLQVANEQADDETREDKKAALWPAIQLAIRSLKINDLDLGQLTLQGEASPNQWRMKNAELSSKVMRASATGDWLQTESDDTSHFIVNVESDDLRALLAHLNYQEVIAARQVKIDADLNWNADPMSFTRQQLNGQLDLSVGRGSLLEVEPGAAGRIFGLLSIAAIPRRLSLDFSDLFGGGFDFSSIKGDFQFNNGIASTKDLTMQGDSAVIEMKGPIDLVNQTYNQVVKITPKVSSTLPIAGAVAGGPVGLGVGTAILLFDKIAGSVLDRDVINLISYSYQLTGPWNDPKLNVVNPAQQ
ncbi:MULTISPECIES: YhdP family protein [unclassified Methylophaga]|uniref:YhdP family protein n=1 Tax=unclassified Methylophaga TaxID=2629249 RepID=UPI000C5925D8|nr:YhdP family protein [Methylophaga sp. UBA678]MAX53301.1 TIGR02099 family protein [Methylophaga sp.]|tara:strand:- start:7730 stop:11542 length:3813 start_codon:yes stop_codon:yes gene_type:complete